MSGATTATYLSAAALAATATSAVANGYATSAADKANAKIAEQNSGIATQNAAFAAQEGESNAGQQSIQNRAASSQIKANQGAGGVDVNTGSNANVQASEAEIGQLNTMTIRSNAARQAYGYQTQAVGFEGQAAADRSAGKNAITSGFINGAADAGKAAAAMAASGGGGGGTGTAGNVSSSQNGISYEDSAFGATTSDPYSSYLQNGSLGK